MLASSCHREPRCSPQLSPTRSSADQPSTTVYFRDSMSTHIQRLCPTEPHNTPNPPRSLLPQPQLLPRTRTWILVCLPHPHMMANPALTTPSCHSGSLSLQAFEFPIESWCIITFLSGKAWEWATALWDTQSPCCTDFTSFTNEMRLVSDRSHTGRQTAGPFLQLLQGSRSMFD